VLAVGCQPLLVPGYAPISSHIKCLTNRWSRPLAAPMSNSRWLQHVHCSLRPHSEISPSRLPRHPAVAYLCFVRPNIYVRMWRTRLGRERYGLFTCSRWTNRHGFHASDGQYLARVFGTSGQVT